MQSQDSIPSINQQQKKEGNCRIIHDKDNSFFIIDGRVAADPRLSMECKGFYFLLLTVFRSKDWGRECLKGLDIVWTKKHKRFLSELIGLGYVEIVEENK